MPLFAPLPLDFARSSSVRTATSALGRRNTAPFRREQPHKRYEALGKHANGGPDGR